MYLKTDELALAPLLRWRRWLPPFTVRGHYTAIDVRCLDRIWYNCFDLLQECDNTAYQRQYRKLMMAIDTLRIVDFASTISNTAITPDIAMTPNFTLDPYVFETFEEF